MRASKKAPDTSDILVPGNPEAKMEQKRLMEGIPILDTTCQEFTAFASRLNLDVEEIIALHLKSK